MQKRRFSHHHHLILAEKVIIRVFFGIVLIYGIIAFVIRLGEVDVASIVKQPTIFFKDLGSIFAMTWNLDIAPVFIFLNAIVIIIFIFSLIMAWKNKPKIKLHPKPTKKEQHSHLQEDHGFLGHWRNIVTKANTGKPDQIRSAIIEADALVDVFLRQHYPGESMGERLKNLSPKKVRSLNRLWEAHKMRNDIAHTPGYEVTSIQAENALNAYSDFLKEMKAF